MENLLKVHKLHARSNVAISNKCNLKCMYCHQALKSDVSFTEILPDDTLDNFVKYSINNGVSSIDITGGGEFSEHPDWVNMCRKLIDAGIKLTSTTNLAKKYTNEELQVISHFYALTISLDSLDRKLLATIRHGSDIRLIIYNLVKINGYIRADNRSGPKIGINTVLNSESAKSIVEMSKGLLGLNIKYVSFTDMHRILPGQKIINQGIELIPLCELNEKQLAPLKTEIQMAIQILKTCDIEVRIQGDLNDTLSRQEAEKKEALQQSNKSLEKSKMTRDCLDPWQLLSVSAKGTLYACCKHSVAYGEISKDANISNLINSTPAQNLRNELLEGKLDKHCSSCHLRPMIKVEEFQKKVKSLYDQ